MRHEPDVVVGAGVVGLSVAIRLSEAGHQVRVVARDLPAASTSAVAAAFWYPYRINPVDRVSGWAAVSLAEFVRLADDPASGVVMRSGTELLRDPHADPWWRDLVPTFARLVEVPAPYGDGWTFDAPVVEMPLYLGWLLERLGRLGVTVEQRELTRIPDDVPLVVNCTGLGARRLADDPTVTPVRGQVLVVSQVGVERWTLDGAGLTYVVPRSRDIVVGGTDAEGEWDLTPDPALALAMLARATALVPDLRGAAVLAHKVGLRPSRPSVRLEVAEAAPGTEAVRGRRTVHCYGHGGAGVTVSWGCADEVVSLVEGAG